MVSTPKKGLHNTVNHVGTEQLRVLIKAQPQLVADITERLQLTRTKLPSGTQSCQTCAIGKQTPSAVLSLTFKTVKDKTYTETVDVVLSGTTGLVTSPDIHFLEYLQPVIDRATMLKAEHFPTTKAAVPAGILQTV